MKHGIHSSSKWLIAATAVVALVAGGLALGSNMGFKFNAQVAGAGTPLPKGDNWVSVPYHTTAVKANDLCSDIGLTSTGVNATRGLVGRLIASSGAPQTYTCGTSSVAAFNLVTGEAVRVRNPVAKSWLPSHF
jgi:hypothetical protein